MLGEEKSQSRFDLRKKRKLSLGEERRSLVGLAAGKGVVAFFLPWN